MTLPASIEIVPPTAPVHAQITLPGSKSITNRALVLAALADGPVTLTGVLWSEDTRIMVEALRTLGMSVHVEPDPAEPANRRVRVHGQAGHIGAGGTPEQPLPLHVGNSGTSARFLSALLCLGHGAYRLSGTERMHERPQASLFMALRALGYRIDAADEQLPATVFGAGPQPGRCSVSVRDSSQFASALLLAKRRGGWEIELAETEDQELSYVEMTRSMLERFPHQGGEFAIEPDASSGSYFAGAHWLLNQRPQTRGSTVHIPGWPTSDWQVDARFPRCLEQPDELSRARDLGDSIMTAIVLAPFRAQGRRFTDLGRLRVQECERVAALRTELKKCGVITLESGDTLEVHQTGQLSGAEVETYRDHRVAMCFGMLGLAVPGMRISDPACARKTFPNFFQKLAAPCPGGLGVRIVRTADQRPLSPDELSAD